MKGMSRLLIAAYKSKYNIEKEIDRTKLEIIELNNEMTGMAHHGLELSDLQLKSSKPMPKTVSPADCEKRLLGLIEKKTEAERKLDYLMLSLNQLKKVESLPVEDQRLLHDLYHSRKNADTVADEHGYTKQGMYKHIEIMLDKVL